MALPTLSNNSPAAGSIAWTASTITFGGKSFPIAAGNTTKRFVWWEYRNGTPAVVTADALPALAAEDCLLFLNKNGVAALVPMTDVVDGSLLVSGSILAGAIAADQIQTYHIDAGAVTATEISAGAVVADKIAAGAVTAEKLTIGAIGADGVANGSFEDGVQGWEVMGAAGGGTADIVTGVSSSGAYALRLVRGTANLQVGQSKAYALPVTPGTGRKWYVSARAGAGSSLASGFYLRAYWYQANGTTASATPYHEVAANKALSTAWTLFEGQVTPPADARYMRVVLINALAGSTMYVDEVTAQEVVVSAQIGDGQIVTANLAADAVTADKIAANAVTAETILAGSVGADAILANSIGADKLVANAITTELLSADAIDGMTITGAHIQTSPEGNRGGKLTESGLTGYNEAGTPVTTIDFKTGQLSAQGAKISGDISGSRMFGGYIEAPTIASSAKLGTGANVLNDPDLTGAINAAWVASGHLGDADAVQSDTFVWDQTWRQTQDVYATQFKDIRNYGNLTVDGKYLPVERKVGTVTFNNRAFLDTAARTFTNPYTFKAEGWGTWVGGGGQSSGGFDPTFTKTQPKPPKAGVERTSYLTNTAVIPFTAGEPWSLRLEHAALADKVKYVSAAVEIVRASDSAVVWSRPITSDELRHGTPVTGSVTPSVTETVKLRVKSVYTAAAGAFVKQARAGGYARQVRDGATTGINDTAGYYMNATNDYSAAGGSRYTLTQASYRNWTAQLAGGDAVVAQIVEPSNVHWHITSAQLSQVTPEKGWALDKESGLRLFNANGAQTGAINGETNFLAGKFATNPTGQRVEMDGNAVTWYDANNQIRHRVVPDGAPYAMAAGVANSVVQVNAQTGANVTITFPPGRFTVPPVVTANADSSRITASVNSRTVNGCVIRCDNWSNGGALPFDVVWQAVQMTPTTSAG